MKLWQRDRNIYISKQTIKSRVAGCIGRQHYSRHYHVLSLYHTAPYSLNTWFGLATERCSEIKKAYIFEQFLTFLRQWSANFLSSNNLKTIFGLGWCELFSPWAVCKRYMRCLSTILGLSRTVCTIRGLQRTYTWVFTNQ